MWRFQCGLGCRPTAASTLRLCGILKALIGGDATWATPEVMTNRCSDYDLSGFGDALNCGSPLSLPCFDFSRCRDGPTVYVYDKECSLADSKNHALDVGAGFWYAARKAGVLAETYESACFFVHVDSYGEEPCAVTAPLWNDGRNHVMFDVLDESRDKRPSYSGSYAMEAATSQHTCYYRSGFDISVGHFPKVIFHGLQSVAPENRHYFLTFRPCFGEITKQYSQGTLHLKFHGSEERQSILALHDEAQGVIVAEHCGKSDTPWRRAAAEMCDELMPTYQAHDYSLLMNSTFGLVPAGASPGTYRLPEVMSAGCIPVFVSRDYIKPFTEEVDWSEFSFTFSPDEVPDIIQTLRVVPPAQRRQMQKKSLDAYWKIYGGKTDYSMMAHHIINIMTKRIRHQES